MIIEIRCENERNMYGTYEKGEHMPYFQEMEGGLAEGVTRLKNAAKSPTIEQIIFCKDEDFRLTLEAVQDETTLNWRVNSEMDGNQVICGEVKKDEFSTFIDRFVESFYPPKEA